MTNLCRYRVHSLPRCARSLRSPELNAERLTPRCLVSADRGSVVLRRSAGVLGRRWGDRRRPVPPDPPRWRPPGHRGRTPSVSGRGRGGPRHVGALAAPETATYPGGSLRHPCAVSARRCCCAARRHQPATCVPDRPCDSDSRRVPARGRRRRAGSGSMAHVVVVRGVELDGLHLDAVEARVGEDLPGQLHAPHRAEALAVVGERHRHAVHARHCVEEGR